MIVTPALIAESIGEGHGERPPHSRRDEADDLTRYNTAAPLVRRCGLRRRAGAARDPASHTRVEAAGGRPG